MPLESGGKEFALRRLACQVVPLHVLSLVVSVSSTARLSCQLSLTSDLPLSSSTSAKGTNVSAPQDGQMNESLIFESSIDRIYYNPSAMFGALQPAAGQYQAQEEPPSEARLVLSPNGGNMLGPEIGARQSRLIYGRPNEVSSFYSLTAPAEAPQFHLAGQQYAQTTVGAPPATGSRLLAPLPTINGQAHRTSPATLSYLAGYQPEQMLPMRPQHQQEDADQTGPFELAGAPKFLMASAPEGQFPNATRGPFQPAPPLKPATTGPHQASQNPWTIGAGVPVRAAASLREQQSPGPAPANGWSQQPEPAPQPEQRLAPRPKVIVNLSSLLRPGEVALSQGAGPRVPSNVSLVNMNELQGLMRKLRPLALSSREKATSADNSRFTLSKDAIRELEAAGQPLDDQQEEDKEDEAEMVGDGEPPPSVPLRPHNGLDRILPSSHLFGGSARLVNGNKARRRRRKPAHENRPERAQQAALLQSLAALSVKLSEQKAADDQEHEQSQQHGQDQDRDQEPDAYGTSASSAPDDFYRPPARREETQAESPAIPIELLVDHLMAGSRRAARARSHAPASMADAGSLSSGPGSNYDGDEDDSDYEDYEEEPGGGLPMAEEEEEEEPQLADESGQRELRIGAPSTRLSYNSVANKSDSWIPLDSIGATLGSGLPRRPQIVMGKASDHLAARELSSSSSQRGAGPGARKRPRSGARRKRRKRRKSMDEHSGLVLAGRKLNRAELIRLIGILNRMASSKKASREREASRNLLRFLIKLALDNYKRGQWNGQEQSKLADGHQRAVDGADQDRRLRDSLRSLLVEPQVGASTANDDGARISIQLQPWRVQSALSQERPIDGQRAKGDKAAGSSSSSDGERPRSLSQISEDLERYFDRDFFEDLADQNVTDKLDNQPADGYEEDHATSRRAAAPTRASRLGAPVSGPMQDRKRLEEADEDDVDLDHVRVSKAPGTLEGRVKVKRRRALRRKLRRTPTSSESNGRAKTRASDRNRVRGRGETDYEDEDDEDVAGAKRKGAKAPAEMARKRRKSPRRTGVKEQYGAPPVDSSAESDRGQSERAGDGADEEAEEEAEEGADGTGEQPASERESDESEVIVAEKRKTGKGSMKDGSKKARKRKKKRRGQQNKRPTYRDEIPAPILTPPMSPMQEPAQDSQSKSKMAPKKQTVAVTKASPAGETKGISSSPNKVSTRNRTKLKKDSKSPEMVKKEPGNISPATSATNKMKPKRAIPGSARQVLNEAGHKNDGDEENYSQEGAQVCENGRCRSELKSSHPGFNKHFKDNPDKTSLTRQIDRWLTAEESDRIEKS